MKKEVVYIGLGSNQGERGKNITDAIDFLKDTPGVSVEKVSSIIETKPDGGPAQGLFLNAVAKIRTGLKPAELLSVLQDIERRLKRVKTVVNGPRTIDLDILLYGHKAINQEDLIIPHPRMCRRLFVLKPLLEIEPAILDNHAYLKQRKDEIEDLIRDRPQ